MIAVYARVSTEEQAKKGFSLKDQVRECRKKAGTDDIVEYVDEAISGEFLDRPRLGALRADIRSGLITKVICLDPDRLSRKLMNQLILSDEIESRAEIVFVNGEYARTPEGQLFYQMRGAISQFEKAKITERMSRGRREKARQGRVLRDFRIYGYDFDRVAEKFIVNEREATIVRFAFELFTNPQGRVKGINGIAQYFTELGVPTKRGAKVFHRQVVRQMLMNRAYIGEFYQNRWNTEGMLGNDYRAAEDRIQQRQRPQDEWIRLPIPALVEERVFHHASQLLAESRRRWAGRCKEIYLLSGLLRCGVCGNTYTGIRRTDWGRVRKYYTDVKKTVGCTHPGCGNYLLCENVDHYVWAALLSWLREPDDEGSVGDDSFQCQGSLEDVVLQRISGELEKLNASRVRAMNLLGEPEIDEEDIRDTLRHIHRKRMQLVQQKEKIEGKILVPEVTDKEHRNRQLKEAWELLLNSTGKNRNSVVLQGLIRSVVKEIRVYDRGAGIEILTQ